MTQTHEENYRIGILNSLLNTPHRDLESSYSFHADVSGRDPLFYQQLAAWYKDNGGIKDHNHLFTAVLCMSDFDGHRDVGLAILRSLPPYELVRVINFIRSKRAIPRSVRTEVTRYLREREQDHAWFDNAAITARDDLKRLYALLHIAPGTRAQQILFDNKPPADSKCFVLKEIAKTTDPNVQARLLNEARIPYRIASTVIKQMTAPVIAVLVDSMSSQELINNVSSLEKRGAFNNPEIKKLIEAKLQKAQKGKGVAALKGVEAIKNANLSADVNEQVMKVVDAQLKSKGRITRPTAILVDKSQSMTQAIDLGKRIATVVSSVMDAPLFVYAFDSICYPIRAKGTDYASWEQAFKGITAGNWTGIGESVVHLLRQKQYVEQIVLITDEGENRQPLYVQAIEMYAREMKVTPHTYIVRCGTDYYKSTRVRDSLVAKGYPVDDYEFKGDYYALPHIITFLTKPSQSDLLMEIMSYELPQRKLVTV